MTRVRDCSIRRDDDDDGAETSDVQNGEVEDDEGSVPSSIRVAGESSFRVRGRRREEEELPVE